MEDCKTDTDPAALWAILGVFAVAYLASKESAPAKPEPKHPLFRMSPGFSHSRIFEPSYRRQLKWSKDPKDQELYQKRRAYHQARKAKKLLEGMNGDGI